MMAQGPQSKRRWPLSPDTVRAVLSGHSVLGLAFAAIIYLVCLTGTIAVFAPDLERWEQPRAPAVAQLSDAAVARAMHSAVTQVPADTSLYVQLPTAERLGASVTAFKLPDFERQWAVDANGALTPVEAVWTDFLLHLHINLHLPRSWGEFLVAMTGVALLSSLVSGVLAHPRLFRDAFHLRLGGARRLQEADLHNRLGVWALPFHFVLALTGALLGLTTLIVGALALLLYRGDTAKVYDMFLDPAPVVDARTAPLPDIAALLARARAQAPGAQPTDLAIQRPGRADMRISIGSSRARNIAQQDETTFDAAGQIVADEHPGDSVLGTRVLAGVGQLHFGWFGGWPVRILYGLLGVALCVVTTSGINIWLARRRDRGRPAAMWERLWAVTVWGQPAILAMAAVWAVFLPAMGHRLPILWLGLSVLSFAGAGILHNMPAKRIAGVLRVATAILLVVTAISHIALHYAHGNDRGWPVDMALLVIGCALLFASFRGKAAPQATTRAYV